MEKFKSIPGYQGTYEVSNQGKVRSILSDPPLIMTGTKNHKGYYKVGLRRNGDEKKFFVHRLVASAFLKKPSGQKFINHKNGKKTDNRASNLSWVSAGENNIHAIKTGLR